jgi:EpsI family protein
MNYSKRHSHAVKLTKNTINLSMDVPMRALSWIKRWPVHIPVLLALFVIIYAPTMAALVRMWWSSDDYSHGFLVPFIALYLVWLKREQLSRLPAAPNLWIGLPVMAAAGLLFILGDLGGVVLLQELSMIVMIAGLAALLFGAAHLNVLALPIAYLLFMVKLFGEGPDGFHRPFQLLASDIGVWLLHAFGFSAYQDGIYIHLPRITLEVAAACSGVRFLVSIIAIGIPLAYMTQKGWTRRIGLVSFAVIIAILANGLRVALIGVWAYNGDVDIHGPRHVLYGTFVSWVGFIALFAGAWFLSSGREGEARRAVPQTTAHEQIGREPILHRERMSQDGRMMRSSLSAIVLLCAVGGYYYFHGVTPFPLQTDLHTFPSVIGEWQGEVLDPRTETLRVDGADEALTRIYRDPAGRAVTLYIGYFDDQIQGKELVGYKTSWKFHRGETKVTIPTEAGRTHLVNQAMLPDSGGSRAVLFWYDFNGRIIASRYEAKLWTIWDALTRGRTNGALVVVSAPVEQRDHIERVFDDERRFIHDAMPSIDRYLPKS